MHRNDCAVTISDLNEMEDALEMAAMQQDQRGAIVAVCDAFDDADITALLRKIFRLDEV